MTVFHDILFYPLLPLVIFTLTLEFPLRSYKYINGVTVPLCSKLKTLLFHVPLVNCLCKKLYNLSFIDGLTFMSTVHLSIYIIRPQNSVLNPFFYVKTVDGCMCI